MGISIFLYFGYFQKASITAALVVVIISVSDFILLFYVLHRLEISCGNIV